MISRICICCGEFFRYGTSEAGESQNICAACSQMIDEETYSVGVLFAEPGKSDNFDEGIKPQKASQFL